MTLQAISVAMDDTGAVVTHRRHKRYTDQDAIAADPLRMGGGAYHEEAKRDEHT